MSELVGDAPVQSSTMTKEEELTRDLAIFELHFPLMGKTIHVRGDKYRKLMKKLRELKVTQEEFDETFVPIYNNHTVTFHYAG